MEWAQILVIILSIFLAIFLLLAIILVTILIKVSRQIKAVTGSAERTVQNVEKAMTNVSNVTTPMYLMKLLKKQLKKTKK